MGDNWANAPGPTPGSKGAVKQHKAMASGYDLPSTPRRVDLNFKPTETGETKAPGLTSRGKRSR